MTSVGPSMRMRREDTNRMGNLGMPELILILVLALLLFGPKKLPEIGKQLGKGLGEFKRASNDLKRSIEDEIEKVGKEEPPGPPPESKPTVAEALPAASGPAAAHVLCKSVGLSVTCIPQPAEYSW